MANVDIASVIARSCWFSGIETSELSGLVASARIRNLVRGSFVYSAGEVTTDIYCLISGRLRLGMTSALGQEFSVTDIEPDSWFGEPALSSDSARLLDAAVIEDSVVLEIPRQTVLELAESAPRLYKNLFAAQVDTNRQIVELLAGMLFYPLRARLAGRLLQLIELHGEEADGGIYVKTKLSQNDFARLSLGSRQRINKIFREWHDHGIVVMKGDQYVIRDLPALQQEIELSDL